MKKINNQTEFDLLQNEYIVHQGQVKSMLGVYIKQRNFAIGFAVVCLLFAIAIAFYSMQITHESKKVDKLVFKQDGSGGLTYLGLINSELKVSDKVILANQMIEFVSALYSIPTDKDKKEYNVAKVEWMTDQKYFMKYPSQYLINAYKTQGNQLITVSPSTSGMLSQGIWEVSWTKYLDGVKIGDFRTLITYKQVDVTGNANAYLYNPLGIVITNIDTIERFSS